MKTISLTRGYVTIVDDDDYDFLMQWKWYAHHRRQGKFYASRSDYVGYRKTVVVSMHRVINKTPDGAFTDHRNGDSLDNRKFNLRNSDSRGNAMNKSPWVAATSSQFKGVSWDKKSAKWRAYIKVNYRNIHLGFFEEELAALAAYEARAALEFGEYYRRQEP